MGELNEIRMIVLIILRNDHHPVFSQKEKERLTAYSCQVHFQLMGKNSFVIFDRTVANCSVIQHRLLPVPSLCSNARRCIVGSVDKSVYNE